MQEFIAVTIADTNNTNPLYKVGKVTHAELNNEPCLLILLFHSDMLYFKYGTLFSCIQLFLGEASFLSAIIINLQPLITARRRLSEW